MYALRVKPVCRLVQNDELRLWKQSLRDAQTLPHAVRIDAHRIMRSLAQGHCLKRCFDARTLCAAGHRRQHAQVLPAREVFVKCRSFDDRADVCQCAQWMSRHIMPQHTHAPSRRAYESERHPQRG